MVALVERLLAARPRVPDRRRLDLLPDRQLARRTAGWRGWIPTQLRVGERVAADEYSKDDVRDFVLWKGRHATASRAGRPRSGPGRPGWHLECSAM